MPRLKPYNYEIPHEGSTGFYGVRSLESLTSKDVDGLSQEDCVRLGIEWAALHMALEKHEGPFSFSYDRRFHDSLVRLVEARRRTHEQTWIDDDKDSFWASIEIGPDPKTAAHPTRSRVPCHSVVRRKTDERDVMLTTRDHTQAIRAQNSELWWAVHRELGIWTPDGSFVTDEHVTAEVERRLKSYAIEKRQEPQSRFF